MLHEFPVAFTAGLTFECALTLQEFSPTEWTLVALLRGSGVIDLVANGIDGTHVFYASHEQTKRWKEGSYTLSIRAKSSDRVVEIHKGVITINADLEAVTDQFDPRTHAQRVLDAIEAVIEGRASKDQQSYTINGRSLVRTTIAELLELRKQYTAEVASEKRGGKPRRLMGRQVKVRFA